MVLIYPQCTDLIKLTMEINYHSKGPTEHNTEKAHPVYGFSYKTGLWCYTLFSNLCTGPFRSQLLPLEVYVWGGGGVD